MHVSKQHTALQPLPQWLREHRHGHSGWGNTAMDTVAEGTSPWTQWLREHRHSHSGWGNTAIDTVTLWPGFLSHSGNGRSTVIWLYQQKPTPQLTMVTTVPFWLLSVQSKLNPAFHSMSTQYTAHDSDTIFKVMKEVTLRRKKKMMVTLNSKRTERNNTMIYYSVPQCMIFHGFSTITHDILQSRRSR